MHVLQTAIAGRNVERCLLVNVPDVDTETTLPQKPLTALYGAISLRAGMQSCCVAIKGVHSQARPASVMLNGLRTLDKQFGVETMCVGGGMGMAMVLERLS